MSETSPDQQYTDIANSVCTELGLPVGFLATLNKDDDWTFIIKTHALLETALSHSITKTLFRPEVSNTISRMNIHAKCQLAEDLHVIESAQVKFIKATTEIRNRLVHNITHVTFNLKLNLSKWPDKKVAWFLASNELDPKVHAPICRDEPRFIIYHGLLSTLSTMCLCRQLETIKYIQMIKRSDVKYDQL